MLDSGPRVFLSSTILDLHDLRSAVKFWLEDFGFEILTSESTDFPHPLDRSAIAAALAPIEGCDYYIVIVGSRVGSVVPDDGISVTRAEFRHARKLRRDSGKPEMLHLVRSDLNVARRIGKPRDISDDDWTVIGDFLHEIETEEEPGDPNWLHTFSSFRDIVDVLRATLHATGPLRRRALEANLVWELIENTRELLFRSEAGTGPKAGWLTLERVPLGEPLDRDVHVGYPGTAWAVRFRLALPRMATLSRSALEEAINSGLFLDYDTGLGSSVVGLLQRSLLDLRQQLLRLEGLSETISEDEGVRRDIAACMEAARVKRGVSIGSTTAAFLHAARSAMDNVVRLNRAIYCHITGLEGTLERPVLVPPTVHSDRRDEEREDVNRREAVTFLRLTAWPEPGSKRSPEQARLVATDEEVLRRLDEAEDAGWSPSKVLPVRHD